MRAEVKPDPGEMAERYGAEMPVPERHHRLIFPGCGSRQIEFVVSGSEKR
jgi:hypothetical protein